jgi:lipoate-protein ligase A
MKIGAYPFDDALLQAPRADSQRRTLVYVPREVQVVLGRGSKPETELHLSACREDGVSVLRRRGGGCAVLLDPGNIVVSVLEHAPGFGQNRAHFRRLSAWLIQSLDRLGVTGLEQRGISDLALGDRKIGGASLHRSRERLLYSVSLLVDPDISLIERYLKHPPREPDYRAGRPHRQFLGTLREAWCHGSPKDLADKLSQVLAHTEPSATLPKG